MNTNNGIVTASFKMDSDLCKEIINFFEYTESTNPSIVINNASIHQGAHNRKDKAIFLDELSTKYSSVVNEHLNQAVQEYCDTYSILTEKAVRIQSTRQKLQRTFIGGGFHSWHFEDMILACAGRMLVWTIYLNDVAEGGETEFLYHSERHKAEEGKIVIFPANYMCAHRGNPPLSNTKYILTGWYTQC